MITPRGYQRKYTLMSDVQALKPHQRLQREAEPWALPQIEQHRAQAEYKTALDWAIEALHTVQQVNEGPLEAKPTAFFRQEAILELAVSPGVANKKFTAQQLITLAEVAGEKGVIELTPHHQIILRIPTTDPQSAIQTLNEAGFMLTPIGDVVQIKACDFCNGEKTDAIPYAEELQKRLGGLKVPKELKIGINGCAMSCYAAVNDDIGIVYRKGKFDLFLGAKTIGRNAHAGIPVAEGLESDHLVGVIERIVTQFIEKGHPGERFHKFFKRVKEIEGFSYRDVPPLVVQNVACGD